MAVQAILTIADNLIRCNHYFHGLAQNWKAQGKDARDIHVKVAGRFCRIADPMVAGRQVFQHPACQARDGTLEKLISFHREHETPAAQVLADLQAATRRTLTPARPCHWHSRSSRQASPVKESPQSEKLRVAKQPHVETQAV